MKRMFMFGLLGLSLSQISFQPNAYAGLKDYQCELRQILSWDSARYIEDRYTGSTFQDGQKLLDFPAVNREAFAVSRQTGQIVGGPFDTQQGLFDLALKDADPKLESEIRVLHRGDADNRFVVSIVSGYGSALILQVREDWDGSIKPFVAMSTASDYVYAGVCR